MTDHPWIHRYDPGVPRTLEPYPERTLLDYVREAAALRPAHPAFVFKGRNFTLAELERTSDAFAAGRQTGRADRAAPSRRHAAQCDVRPFFPPQG